jgi:uncharacterized protein
MSTNTTVLLLPGWLNSGPTHWQSLWEQAHGYTRVQQHDWQRPLRGDWCARLQEVVVNHIAQLAQTPRSLPPSLSKSELPVHYSIGLEHDLTTKNSKNIILVAHSLGCHLVAAWAAASRHASAVRAALLVAPPDLTQSDLPPDLFNWRKPILNPLPFPTTCVISSNDPFSSHAAGRAIAAAWGARCVEAGPLGHINGDSGLGHWPAGQALLANLINARIGELIDEPVARRTAHPTSV